MRLILDQATAILIFRGRKVRRRVLAGLSYCLFIGQAADHYEDFWGDLPDREPRLLSGSQRMHDGQQIAFVPA